MHPYPIEANKRMEDAHAHAKTCNTLVKPRNAKSHSEMRRAWVEYAKARHPAVWAQTFFQGATG